MQKYKLKNTIKYPTSLIINGLSNLGVEIAESLLEQGGYVIIIDSYNAANVQSISDRFGSNALLSFLDYTAIPHLEEDLRRLDYVFYFAHDTDNLTGEVSTQTFLKYSNYLDSTLSLAVKFEAKFLLTTLIKAHQLVMDNMDMEVNFGKTATVRHTVYTEMEVQRYSESLCLEYVNKTNLNARIIRLGELIGQGVDLTHKTPFTKLILDTVAGKNLELLNDGLESEWYVHVTDAAYGIIKAQFTKDTVGELYSLAYDGAITHLSIAYKIQEIEPEAHEITFVEDKDHLPPIRLHKPAPNLEVIGWKPKIEFEQALAESLAAAKLFVLQNDRLPAAKENVTDKIKSFLNIANQDSLAADEGDGSPVSRLIAERRQAEQAREAAMSRADIELKLKRKARSRSIPDRIQNILWDLLRFLREHFSFIGNITPTQLFLYLIGFGVLLFLYFNLFSPLVVLARNAVIINNSVSSISNNISFNNLDQLYDSVGAMHSAFAEDSQIFNNFIPTLRIFAADKYVVNLSTTFDQYAQMADGYENILNALKPLSTYLGRYANNIKFRPASDSYLTVGTSLDYSSVLQDINNRKAYITSGIDKINAVQPQIKLDNFDYLPSFLATPLRDLNSRLASLNTHNELALTGESLGELLGVGTPHTYLVFLVDNSKPMPLGGELAAYMLLTVYNGSVSEIRLQSIDAFSASLTTLPKYIYDQINAHLFTPKTPAQINTRDLALIGDYDLFSETADTLWSKAFSRNVDMVLTMNLQALDGLVTNVGNVQVEGQTIAGSDLLTDLLHMQTDTPTIARRHDLLAQIWAQAITANLDKYASSSSTILEQLADMVAQKNLQISTANLDYRRVIDQYNMDGEASSAVPNFLNISITSDPQVISPEKYPAFSQEIQTTVQADMTVHYQVVVKFPAISNADIITACVPGNATNIVASGIDKLRSKIVSISNQICIIGDIISETEIGYAFDVKPIETWTGSQYNLELSQIKLPGVLTTTDFEISLSPTLKVDQIEPNTLPTDGKIIFTQNMADDLLIDLLVSKK